MSAARLAEVLDLLQWTPTTLARLLDCQPKVVRRWLGVDPLRGAVPGEVADWLEALHAAHMQNPPPMAWKRRGV